MRLYDGATFQHKGMTFTFRTEHDEAMREPWIEEDGHGIVSDWTTCDKRPGERVLVTDHSHRRYYDVAETLKIARRDGWGSAGDEKLGRRAKAAKAVDEDFERLRAWCHDEWQWIGVIVTETISGESASLFGIESDAGDYLETVAHELADDIRDTLRERSRPVEDARMIAPWADAV